MNFRFGAVLADAGSGQAATEFADRSDFWRRWSVRFFRATGSSVRSGCAAVNLEKSASTSSCAAMANKRTLAATLSDPCSREMQSLSSHRRLVVSAATTNSSVSLSWQNSSRVLKCLKSGSLDDFRYRQNPYSKSWCQKGLIESW